MGSRGGTRFRKNEGGNAAVFIWRAESIELEEDERKRREQQPAV
jgi:hypothetical protein